MKSLAGRLVSLSSAVAFAVAMVSLPLSASAQGRGLFGTSSHGRAPVSTEAVRPLALDVRDGVLTIDGLVAKVHLNYDVHSSFVYFTVPGVGTAIVAREQFANAQLQSHVFHGDTLRFDAQGRVVELSGVIPLPGKGAKAAEDAWIAIDPHYGATLVTPEMGFGDTYSRPYVWPGVKPVKQKPVVQSAYAVAPPPVPANLLPRPEPTETVVARTSAKP